MSYRDQLSQALVALGVGDETAALAALRAAEEEAARVDPDGPRVAEVLNYAAQIHMHAGRLTEARQALERVAAIWERFPALAEGLADFYLQLMGLCSQVGDRGSAEHWQEKAREAAQNREPRPRR
jgi:tetratricopeptide (TPR) repeat protein